MDEKKFDDMMEKWAADEQSSAPRLRPTQDMYDMLKTKRQASWFPVMARWATVGVAAAIIVVVAILHPSLSPFPPFQEEKVSQEVVEYDETDEAGEEIVEDARRETLKARRDDAETPVMADKEKQEPLTYSEGMTGEAESSPPPADKWNAKRTLPESLEAPPAPVPEEPAETSVVLQKPGRTLGLESSDAPRPVEPQPMPAIARSRMKGTPSIQQEHLDADRQILLKNEQKKAPIEDDVTEGDSVGDGLLKAQQPIAQQAIIEECTPVPGASFSVPSGSAVEEQSSGRRSILPETLPDEAEADLSTEFMAPASPKICALPAAEKIIGSKTFRLQENLWVDTEYEEALATEQERLIIQRDSQAYTDLLTLVPEIKVYEELNEPMIISLGKMAVEIGDKGKTQLTEEDVRLLKSLQIAP